MVTDISLSHFAGFLLPDPLLAQNLDLRRASWRRIPRRINPRGGARTATMSSHHRHVKRHAALRLRRKATPSGVFGNSAANACVLLPKSTHPIHPTHARCGGLSFCRFTDQRTASVPPAETFMTCLTQSGHCCFFYFSPTDTSKCRPTTSEDTWVVFIR